MNRDCSSHCCQITLVTVTRILAAFSTKNQKNKSFLRVTLTLKTALSTFIRSFWAHIIYSPSKQIPKAGALSRAPTREQFEVLVKVVFRIQSQKRIHAVKGRPFQVVDSPNDRHDIFKWHFINGLGKLDLNFLAKVHCRKAEFSLNFSENAFICYRHT